MSLPVATGRPPLQTLEEALPVVASPESLSTLCVEVTGEARDSREVAGLLLPKVAELSGERESLLLRQGTVGDGPSSRCGVTL